jgi:hypothetical protein
MHSLPLEFSELLFNTDLKYRAIKLVPCVNR